MKRTSILITVVFVLLQLSNGLWAAPTTAFDAEMVVRGWLKTHPQPLGAALGQEVIRVETFTNDVSEPVYYIVYLAPSGFVIVSADDLIEPVIGFSDEGTYGASLESPLGALVTSDLGGRISAVRNSITLFTTNTEPTVTKTQKKWNYFMSLAESSEGNFSLMVEGEDISDMRVAPLLKTIWGQRQACGFDCYNYYTPNYCPCGCLPTGMAQLMHYHQYPVEPNDYDPSKPDGRRRFIVWAFTAGGWPDGPQPLRGGDGNGGPYEWDKMVNVPSCNTTEEQRRAIGAICYDAGIASGTIYTDYGSSTSLPEAHQALLDVFDFANAIEGWNDANNIDKENLDKMINPNLDAGNPVILGVFDLRVGSSAGHAVMCDGYGYVDSTMYHHINLGWDYLPTECRQVWYELPDISGECEWQDDRYIYFLDYSYNAVIMCLYNIFTTETGEIISGRIVDAQDEPFGGVLVTAYSERGGEPYITTTNDKGVYALKGLSSNTTYTIITEMAGYNFNPDSIEVETGRSENNSPVCGNKWGVDFVGDIDAETITIGVGTSNWDYPMHTEKQDSRTQVIYLAEEIGRSGNIKLLALDITRIPWQSLENWTIRMKHTNKSEYNDCLLEAEGWTVVYQNNESISDTGWHQFSFHALFEYNGVDNLLVDFSHNNSSRSENGRCRVSQPGGMRSVCAYSDSQHGNPLDWPVTTPPAVSCNSNVPNVKLFLSDEGTIICGDIKLIASDGERDDHFGYAVSISGDYAIVGAPGPANGEEKYGSAYIFKRDGANWIQQAKLTPPQVRRERGGFFGGAVSIDGNYAIVGSSGPRAGGGYCGYAYVFKREGTSWTQQDELYASGCDGDDEFGHSVSICGDNALVGAIYNGQEGSAYLFERDGTRWTQQAIFTDTGLERRDRFGEAVSVSEDYAIVATEKNINQFRGISGIVYVFNRDGTSWNQQARLRASDGVMDHEFGHSLSISGDYFIAGAPGDDDNGNGSGAVYVFGREGTSWSEQAKLKASDGLGNDAFGQSAIIKGDYIIVGAPSYDDDLAGRNSGSIYIFKLEGDIWTQQIKITAEDGAMDDHFGCSVSIDGYYAIVGVDGDDDNGSNSGSAYIFRRGCANWPQ